LQSLYLEDNQPNKHNKSLNHDAFIVIAITMTMSRVVLLLITADGLSDDQRYMES
jgi:hypothetical protein